MLHIDRRDEPVPACLSDDRAMRGRDLLRAAFADDFDLVSQTRYEMRHVAVQDTELQAATERLFRGRCAFCERAVPTKPYRFRPTEEAGPTTDAPDEYADRAHLYYLWLANSWDNIYPICETCFPLEPSVFPVRGKRCPLPERRDVELYADQPTGTWRTKVEETPILLDPCGNEDFRKHLAIGPDGRIVGIDERGDFTIRHFNLDRVELQRARRDAIRSRFKKLVDGGTKAAGSLFDFASMSHGGTWFLLLGQLARKIGSSDRNRSSLSQKRIKDFYLDRLPEPEFRSDLAAAFDDLAQNGPQLERKRIKRSAPSISAPLPLSFKISNFKSIEALEISLPQAPADEDSEVPRSAAMMILGENAAGKSSILEAIALAVAPHEVRLDLTGDARPFMLNPRYMGGSGTPRRGMVEVRYEKGVVRRLRIEPGWPEPTVQSAMSADIPLFAYGAFRLFLERRRMTRAAAPILSLFQPDFVLPNPERWLASLHGTPAFPEVVRALRSILAIDQPFDVIEPDEHGEFCLSIASIAADGTATRIRTPLTVVSSGFRSVLGMACAVMRGLLDAQNSRSASLARARAIVLIDEVEAHLHPRWKMRIMTGLRQSLPNVTFIVTTHDPLCLRGMQSNEVVVLRRIPGQDDGAGGCAERVEAIEDIPALDSLTVEQLLTSDLFQLFSTDAHAIEDSLARTGDLLALEKSGTMSDAELAALTDLRAKLHDQVKRSMPIGSTQVEQIIQEAVELYLEQRRTASAKDLAGLQAATKASIVAALERL